MASLVEKRKSDKLGHDAILDSSDGSMMFGSVLMSGALIGNFYFRVFPIDFGWSTEFGVASQKTEVGQTGS